MITKFKNIQSLPFNFSNSGLFSKKQVYKYIVFAFFMYRLLPFRVLIFYLENFETMAYLIIPLTPGIRYSRQQRQILKS